MDFQELYLTAATWCYLHQSEFEILIVAAILYCVLDWREKAHRQRRSLSRKLRGLWMSKKNQELYALMRLEDAVQDCLDDMKWEGRISDGLFSELIHMFADNYKMKGLLPMKDVKRSINKRLARDYHLMTKPKIPGDPPGVKADASYDGSSEMKKSQWE